MKSKGTVLLVLLIMVSMIFAGCNSGVQNEGDNPFHSEYVSDEVIDLIISYFQEEESYGANTYLATDEPEEPQEYDFRIETIKYEGEMELEESLAICYLVGYSRYYIVRGYEDDLGKPIWEQGQPIYIVLDHSTFEDTFNGVCGITYKSQPKPVDQIILEVVYNLMDIEVSLTLDDYPHYVGPLSEPDFFNEQVEVEVLEEYEPIYEEDGQWLHLGYDGFSVLCYYSGSQDVTRVYSIEATRTDVATYRGIRVGMTREDVINTYPKLFDTDYWGLYGDYLWYSNNDAGWGPSLIFWFDGDTVEKIQLNFMFD
ncbi:MAG: hypothetical protein GX828_02135 [Clostridiales bacterium]|nr:hypothetical protein [Clostridiales bacterium]